MMTLDQPRATKAFGCQKTLRGGDVINCLVVAGIIVPAGSFIISGSIVLFNNTLHWLEYQGGCDNTRLDEQAEQFKKAQTKN